MNKFLLFGFLVASLTANAVSTSEISVTLALDHQEYVSGERIRAVVDVANASPDTIIIGHKDSTDALFLEAFRASDRHAIERVSSTPFTVPFMLKSSEGQKLEVFMADHFDFSTASRYLVRAVLVHDGIRYEGSLRSFDVVPGMKAATAIQMFAGRPGLRREFTLVYWGRDRLEHAFLKINDEGEQTRRWETYDLGAILRVTRPKISVCGNGEVLVLHRASQDSFIRSVFWSLPDALEFQSHDVMTDPDVAGTQRVKALYMEAGGVQPVRKAWWKFW